MLIVNPPGTTAYAAGVDLADGERLGLALVRSGPGLLRRLFNRDERAACADGTDLATTARLFGIKESVIKAAGGLPPGGRYRDIEIDTTGADTVAVTLRGELGRWADTTGVQLVAGGAPLADGPVLAWALASAPRTGEEEAC
jgi:holo-[acyl-carrier protein] synthase